MWWKQLAWCSCSSLWHDITAWISWFLGTKGNEYFCEVDEEYILDRFNLTGLNSEVHHYAQAMDLITDSLGKPFQLRLPHYHG